MKNFSFIKNQKIFFGIAIAVFVLGLISFFTLGFNVDIDFVGGTEISFNVGTSVSKQDEAEIEALIIEKIGEKNYSSLRISDDVITIRTKIIDNADKTEELSLAVETKVNELFPEKVILDSNSKDTEKYFLRTDKIDENTTAKWTEDEKIAVEEALKALNLEEYNVSLTEDALAVTFTTVSPVAKTRSDITEAINSKYENATWLSTDTVGSEISAGLRKSAIIATVAAVALMLVYIAFRFQISSAFAAIVCLVHDIFVVCVAYSVLQIPVNSTIIAALLTILGYSINATIIIFDRIRENNKKLSAGKEFASKVDDGIRSTLSRSINTTITTLFTITMVYILGVTSIKNFALPLIVGIISGLFSSVCLAGPLWNLFKNIGKKNKR